MGMIPVLAYLINWGWLKIGPPYIYININPIIGQVGPIALRWYGLMYAVAIIVGLWAIGGYVERKGITEARVFRIVWWCIIAGLIGGRLYFVIQQPNLYQDYILQPLNIIAVWQGGMAFYGAIFLIIPTLLWRARVERVNPLVLIDAGVLFAAVGQIFGRIGNLINGDIIGFRTTLPWGTVYQSPQSWACLNPATCNVPVQPAAGYELLIDVVMLILLLILARRVRRPGIMTFVYLFSYTISQFLVFFVRDNVITTFFGLNWGLKQAQWTSIVVFIVLIPLTYVVMRYWKYARPIPDGEVAATYDIPQEPLEDDEEEETEETEETEPEEIEQPEPADEPVEENAETTQ
ncbi:MAG TPA: prolipoprotein diacylglyceryl transferase [Ktedonobacteraceae bacterium]|nr:prolipoprotein diacylglyceryl transferase [Ktedonobacteraceae bacterium]